MLSEGGTEHGHQVTIARSRFLDGPYTPCPANPILTHFSNQMQNSPIQGVGHADLVDAPDGSWWMICLGYRTHGYLQHVMGRETFLAPVRWDKNAWPVVNGDGTLQIDMDCPTLPQVEMPEEPLRDEFDKDKLELYWSYLCNPHPENYSLAERKGYLRLKASGVSIDELGSPTFIGRRQTEINFQTTAAVDISHIKEGTSTGLTAYAARLNHYDVRVTREDGKNYVEACLRVGQIKHIEKKIPIRSKTVYLRIKGDTDFYYLSYSEDNKRFEPLCQMEYRYLSTETIGGFTGVHFGLFIESDAPSGSYADFDWIEVVND